MEPAGERLLPSSEKGDDDFISARYFETIFPLFFFWVSTHLIDHVVLLCGLVQPCRKFSRKANQRQQVYSSLSRFLLCNAPMATRVCLCNPYLAGIQNACDTGLSNV